MSQASIAKYKRFIISLLADKPVAYHPDVAKALGSVKACVFLLQLLYWNFNDTTEQRDGWLWKTSRQMYDETGLSEKEQASARKFLAALNVIEVDLRTAEFMRDGKLKKGLRKIHWYKVDIGKVSDIVISYYDTKTPAVQRKARNPKQPRSIKGRFIKSHRKLPVKYFPFRERTHPKIG
jgi:hypothetical protein